MFQDLQGSHVYVAHPDYLEALCQEVGEVIAVHGNLVFSRNQKHQPCFAQDQWWDACIVRITSIGEASKILKAQKIIWHPNIVECARRTVLISEKLPLYRDRPLKFPLTRALPKIGCFSLLDANTLIYATNRWKAVPNGAYVFEEDKVHPPNRAYLKLWEALCYLGKYPTAGDRALDLGASPGGWTYVLQSLGAEVIAIDKAPLDPKIAHLPRVTSRIQSAFSIEPAAFEKLDWLVCDIACYPERLYQFLQAWIASGKVRQFICTIKLQGDIDFAILEKFRALPNSTTLHLFHNKNEVTWLSPGIEK